MKFFIKNYNGEIKSHFSRLKMWNFVIKKSLIIMMPIRLTSLDGISILNKTQGNHVTHVFWKTLDLS
jgi:hypothetical protein